MERRALESELRSPLHARVRGRAPERTRVGLVARVCRSRGETLGLGAAGADR